MVQPAGGKPAPQQLQKLLRLFSEQLRKAPEDVQLRLKLAEVLRLLGRNDEAVNLYSSVAWTHALAGNLVQAIMLCTLILELNPKHDETQQMLATLYASKAEREHKRAVPVQRVGNRWVVDPAGDDASSEDDVAREEAAATPAAQGGGVDAAGPTAAPLAPSDSSALRAGAMRGSLPSTPQAPAPPPKQTFGSSVAFADTPVVAPLRVEPTSHDGAAVVPVSSRGEQEPVDPERDTDKLVRDDRGEPPPRDTMKMGSFSYDADGKLVPGPVRQDLVVDDVRQDLVVDDVPDTDEVETRTADDDEFNESTDVDSHPSTGDTLELTPGKPAPPAASASSPGVAGPAVVVGGPGRRAARATEPIDMARIIELHGDDHPSSCYAVIRRQVREASERVSKVELEFEDTSSTERRLSDALREACGDADTANSELAGPDLPALPLFSDLSPGAFVALVRRLRRRFFPAGSAVVTEGEPGDSLMLVSAGSLRVLKSDEGRQIELAQLGPGSFFGEFGLLTDQRRHASVVCVDDCEVLELSKEVLVELIREYPSVAETLRAYYQRRVLELVMATCPVFSAVSAEEREPVLARFTSRTYVPGEIIVEQGKRASFFCVIVLGRVAVSRVDDDGSPLDLGQLTEGDYFGESSLMSKAPVRATARAIRRTEILALDSKDFYDLASSHPEIWVQMSQQPLMTDSGRLPPMRKAGALLL